MQFVTHNIQYSKGADGVYDLGRAVAETRGGDVIALQEVVRNGPGLPDADQPASIADLFGGYHWVYGPALDMDIGAGPGVRLQFGNMLLSRYPILGSRLLLLPRVRTYDKTSIERCALEALIDAPGGPLRVYSVHLDSVNSRHRRAEIEWLRGVVLMAGVTGTTLTGPPPKILDVPSLPIAPECVVMGDFNIVPGSTEYDELVGEDDYYRGRVVAGDRLADTWTLAGHAIDEGVTWSDESISTKLDYVFVSPGLAGQVKKAWIDVDSVSSDHRPVWMAMER